VALETETVNSAMSARKGSRPPSSVSSLLLLLTKNKRRVRTGVAQLDEGVTPSEGVWQLV